MSAGPFWGPSPARVECSSASSRCEPPTCLPLLSIPRSCTALRGSRESGNHLTQARRGVNRHFGKRFRPALRVDNAGLDSYNAAFPFRGALHLLPAPPNRRCSAAMTDSRTVPPEVPSRGVIWAVLSRNGGRRFASTSRRSSAGRCATSAASVDPERAPRAPGARAISPPSRFHRTPHAGRRQFLRLSHQQKAMRVRAAFAGLRRFPSPRSRAVLEEALAAPHLRVRLYAAESLLHLGDPAGRRRVLALLGCSERDSCWLAATAAWPPRSSAGWSRSLPPAGRRERKRRPRGGAALRTSHSSGSLIHDG